MTMEGVKHESIGNPDEPEKWSDDWWEKTQRELEESIAEKQAILKKATKTDVMNSLQLRIKSLEGVRSIVEQKDQYAYEDFDDALEQGLDVIGVTEHDIVYSAGNAFSIEKIDWNTEEIVLAVVNDDESRMQAVPISTFFGFAGTITSIDKVSGHKRPEGEALEIDIPEKPVAPRSRHRTVIETDRSPDKLKEFKKRADFVEEYYTSPLAGPNNARQFLLNNIDPKIRSRNEENGNIKIREDFFSDKSNAVIESVLGKLKAGYSFSRLLDIAINNPNKKEQKKLLREIKVFGARFLHAYAPADREDWDGLDEEQKAMVRLAERVIVELEMAWVNIKAQNEGPLGKTEEERYAKHFEEYGESLDISSAFKNRLHNAAEKLELDENMSPIVRTLQTDPNDSDQFIPIPIIEKSSAGEVYDVATPPEKGETLVLDEESNEKTPEQPKVTGKPVGKKSAPVEHKPDDFEIVDLILKGEKQPVQLQRTLLEMSNDAFIQLAAAGSLRGKEKEEARQQLDEEKKYIEHLPEIMKFNNRLQSTPIKERGFLWKLNNTINFYKIQAKVFGGASAAKTVFRLGGGVKYAEQRLWLIKSRIGKHVLVLANKQKNESARLKYKGLAKWLLTAA